MFRKTPFILLAVIALSLLIAPVLTVEIKESLYAISLTIKEIIVFLLPLIIFCLLFKAAVSLSETATKLIAVVLIMVCCSNFFTTFMSHYIGHWIYQFDLSIITPSPEKDLQPLWSWHLPKWVPNSYAMFGGIITGILSARFYPNIAQKIASNMEQLSNIILRGIIYVIPLFVTGFIIKLQQDGLMFTLIKDYTSVFGYIVLTLIGYLTFIYLIIHQGNWKSFNSHLRNILPAAISGFTTMSSAASMPLTIIGTQNVVRKKQFSQSIIPATVNIHLVGDCVAIPIFAYAVLKSFGMEEPTLANYFIFTCYFVLAKFSVAAVPGGGIIVMLPILENYLGFNAAMLSLITALYFLFDPIITCANVIGNSAFVKAIDRCNFFLEKNPKKTSAIIEQT